MITQDLYNTLLKASSNRNLRQVRVKFMGHTSTKTIPVLGRAKLVLTNKKDLKVKVIAYVVENSRESLLGRCDGLWNH